MSSSNLTTNIDPKLELDQPSDVKPKQGPVYYDNTQQNDDDDKFHSFSESCEEEKEPLFVIDKTHNFRLSKAIQYDSYQSIPKNQSVPRVDTGSRQNACWNCGFTDHSLHNCPNPKNQRIINQNRQLFLAQKQSQQQHFGNRNARYNRKNNRYFLQQSNNSLYNKFTPGKLSNTLLDALGVPENGIPVHIYKMREIGYPRAWIEEAREEYSGISIFTAPNKCLPLPGREDGANDFFCNINEKKLHEYPGFNVPSHPDAVDECKKYSCPEFNPEQSLKHMFERLKTGKNLMECSKDYSSSEDTGFVSTNGTLTGEESLLSKVTEEDKSIIHPPSSPEDGEITDDDSIEENNEKSPSNVIKSETIVDEQNDSDVFKSIMQNKDDVNDAQISLSKSKNSESELTPTIQGVKRKFCDIKYEVLGTPVLKHFSPYENRPTHAKFAKGMVDLVDHENLPNSIGTFAKMKEILKDVRKTLNNLL